MAGNGTNMVCQCSCSTYIKLLYKEILTLKEMCFVNQLKHKEERNTMENTVEELNNAPRKKFTDDDGLIGNYSTKINETAAGEQLKDEVTKITTDEKSSDTNLFHDNKLENVLLLQKILENQLTMQKEFQDIRTDVRKLEEAYDKRQGDIESSSGVNLVADLLELKETCDRREKDSENIKADLTKLKETCEKSEDCQTISNLKNIETDLKILQETCDRREKDSQTFRKNLATLKETENIKADLTKLKETFESSEKDCRTFRTNLKNIETDLKILQETCEKREKDFESIENIRADLRKIEDTCDKRQENIQTIRKSLTPIDEKATQQCAKNKDNIYIPPDWDHEQTQLVYSILKVYPENFYIYFPNCLNFRIIKEPSDLRRVSPWLFHLNSELNFIKFYTFTIKGYLVFMLEYRQSILKLFQQRRQQQMALFNERQY